VSPRGAPARAATHAPLAGWINELKTRWNRMTGGSEPFDPKK
jgi:hypothetical protein